MTLVHWSHFMQKSIVNNRFLHRSIYNYTVLYVFVCCMSVLQIIVLYKSMGTILKHATYLLNVKFYIVTVLNKNIVHCNNVT